jgi:diguanylate cyclase (GGDEF)-like protein/PAS domain S-box-containing protein
VTFLARLGALIAYPKVHFKRSDVSAGDVLIPILLGIILSLLVTVLSRALEERENLMVHMANEDEVQNMLAIVNADLNNRIHALQRIVKRWELHGGTPRDEFVSDAQAIMADNPGYLAIEWVDARFNVQWITPLAGNEAAQGLNLAFEKQRRIALKLARDQRTPTLSSPVDLVQGGKGFLVYCPIYLQEQFGGFILAVFRAEEWLSHLVGSGGKQHKPADFHTAVSIDDHAVFEDKHWSTTEEFRWDAQATATIFGHRFMIKSRPTEHYIQQSDTRLPELIFALGLLLSLLISIIAYLFQRSQKAVQLSTTGKIALEREISTRKMVEQQLATGKQRLTYILEGTNAGTWEWNVQTGEATFNERWADIIGYRLTELTPISIDTWTSNVHPDDLEKSSHLLEKHFNGELEYYECDARMRHKKGHWVWVMDRGQVSTWTHDGKPLLVCGTHQDITERRLAEEKIRHLATHDALTNLPSLRLVKDRINVAISMARRNQEIAAILFIDLDSFKAINDRWGHEAGDTLLREVAQRLINCVRESDTVARIGGDEFLIALPELQAADDAAQVAQKLLYSLAQPFIFRKTSMTIGASIGISLYPNNGEDAQSLIKQADQAMYTIKKRGKNGYSFAPTTA